MKIAIQGHPTRGNEVIQILKSLGGYTSVLLGNGVYNYYYIDETGNIGCVIKPNITYEYKRYTLEEFEKEFPFKIGDKVKTDSGKIGIVIGLVPGDCQPYIIRTNLGEFWCKTHMMHIYKEMERNITLTLEKAKEWYNKGGELKIEIPNGYQIDEEKSTFTKIVFRPIEKKYVDLGLPSGTLWCDTNEDGFYTYDEAVDTFKDNLPNLTQYAELLEYCDWKWDSDKKGMSVIGKNGNCIFLPAAGSRNYDDGDANLRGSNGYYWSSRLSYDDNAYRLYFSSSRTDMGSFYRARGYSVRLIKNKN